MVHTSVRFPPSNSKQGENMTSFFKMPLHLEASYKNPWSFTKTMLKLPVLTVCLIFRFIFLASYHRVSQDMYCFITENNTGRVKIFPGCFFFSGQIFRHFRECQEPAGCDDNAFSNKTLWLFRCGLIQFLPLPCWRKRPSFLKFNKTSRDSR